MYPTYTKLLDSDFASELRIPAVAPEGACTARNLCELFLHELAHLVAGAGQAERAAYTIAGGMHDQSALRRLVLGLAKSSCACVPSLAHILRDEGLTLSRAHDDALTALLRPIHPEPVTLEEPFGIIATRTVNVLRQVTLYLKTQVVQAAEHAHLLGSDRLYHALVHWALILNNYNIELRSRASRFHAQAYAADLYMHPRWHAA